VEAIRKAGYRPGRDVGLGIDAAASEFYRNGFYFLKAEKKPKRTSVEMIDYYEYLVKKFPILSIEDGLSEDDWKGWKAMTLRLGKRVQLVGDDLFVTIPSGCQRGSRKGSQCHSDQTQSDWDPDRTLEVIKMAQKPVTEQSSHTVRERQKIPPSQILP